MNCDEMTILMQFLLSYNDDDYTRARLYDLNYVLIDNKDLKTFQ